ncbi:hypothetical protein M0G74_04810 [Microbulbifer sp. CAU 1566]|uniref:hypothetical protein n=1 Tax=Microbulbifer sp. CAU 1566 TaxID=2933269 RepID=UPI002006A3A9|nr:hypothetical protein [Microbulbifer sp. CAU 1566]MCK7596592.1 hypothetical protein [Microbulbifer sp. CAU 1566]
MCRLLLVLLLSLSGPSGIAEPTSQLTNPLAYFEATFVFLDDASEIDCSQDRELKVRQRDSLVGKNLGNAEVMRSLQRFGLHKLDDGGYEADIENFPDWLAMSDLISVLSRKSILESAKQDLHRLGVSNMAISVLQDMPPWESQQLFRLKASLLFLKNNKEKYRAVSERSGNDFLWAEEFLAEWNKATDIGGFELIEPICRALPVTDRKIIFDYMAENFGKKAFYGSSASSSDLREIAEQYISGKWEESIEQEMEQRRMK